MDQQGSSFHDDSLINSQVLSEKDLKFLMQALKIPSTQHQAMACVAMLCSSKGNHAVINPFISGIYHRGGLDILQQVILTSRDCQTLKVALMALASCIEQDGNCKFHVYTQSLYNSLYAILSSVVTKDAWASAAYLISCLVFKNGRGQVLAGNSRCLHGLCDLLSYAIERREVSETMVYQNSICQDLMASVTCAITCCIANPTNGSESIAWVVPKLFLVLKIDCLLSVFYHLDSYNFLVTNQNKCAFMLPELISALKNSQDLVLLCTVTSILNVLLDNHGNSAIILLDNILKQWHKDMKSTITLKALYHLIMISNSFVDEVKNNECKPTYKDYICNLVTILRTIINSKNNKNLCVEILIAIGYAAASHPEVANCLCETECVTILSELQINSEVNVLAELADYVLIELEKESNRRFELDTMKYRNSSTCEWILLTKEDCDLSSVELMSDETLD
ncbi:hypothetical protein TrispH2_006058 [Trichoplax sp. H2]|nr:hypothetical protein TrispH2_006058 [Trichoplax sp. H2]|eukprot:RDD43118.1 hypothetical protein TrispH2_006058 [Trichoplax sp. H2]